MIGCTERFVPTLYWMVDDIGLVICDTVPCSQPVDISIAHMPRQLCDSSYAIAAAIIGKIFAQLCRAQHKEVVSCSSVVWHVLLN